MKKTDFQNPILVFPSSTTSSLDFLNRCKSMGLIVYGASSLHIDPNAKFFDTWNWLPLINNVDFECELLNFVSIHRILKIFCPIPVAHKRIEVILTSNKIDCSLLPSPFDSELLRYQELNMRAYRAIAMAESIVDMKMTLSLIQVKTIFNHTDTVWGQCGELKLAALMAIMSDTPKGDVVEIGVFLGKSAVALVMLAKWYQTGKVIAIDSWNAVSAIQKDAPEYVQQLSLGSYWNAIADQFIVNLMAIVDSEFNYIRDSSKNARIQYATGIIQSKEFGLTTCCGRIAVLHIDGNHDYDAVLLDATLWFELILPGGWVIFDDYLWPHGNGPRKVGDQVLNNYSAKIQTSFVCDGALFIKINSILK